MAQTEISIIPFILCSLFEFLTDSVTDSFPIKLAETASYRSTYDGTDPGIIIEPITAPALLQL
jgi:hypothetical protein